MKTFLVTGANEPGIGQAITKLILSNGHAVIGTIDKNADIKPKDRLQHTNLALYEVDHADETDLSALYNDHLSNIRLSGYVNAQMYFNMENITTFDHALWKKSVSVNLTMPNFVFRTILSQLDDAASVVMLSTTEAFVGSFGASAYAASRAGLHNLVQSLANISGSRAIRVNAVAPGWIGGVMDTDEVFNMSREITPLGRLGSPDEVANVIDFLLSEKSSFVNGTVIVVDGGYTGVDRIAKFEFESVQ